MSSKRKKMYRRLPRFSRRFLVLVGAVAIGIFAYFIGILAVGDDDEHNGEADGPQYIADIDISLLRTDFDDAALVYIFYYEDGTFDISRHHIIDNEGLVNFASFNPARGQMSIFTDVPVVFFTEYSYETQNVYISATNPRQLFDRILIIDPGHGGADYGAVVGSIRESDIVLDISLLLYEMLGNSDSGIKAYLTRDSDSFVHNARRAHIANVVGDMLVSVHTNAYPPSAAVYGTEVLFNDYSPMAQYGNAGRISLQNSEFAQIMQDQLVAALGTRDRGIVERRDLILLNTSAVPTAFVEIDFKTNALALANLTDAEYQQRVARALYDGIMEAFGRAQ